MDPSALKWHDWAKDEAQLHGKKGDLVRSPPRSVSSSTSTITSPPPHPMLSPKQQHQEPSDKIMCGKPTREELKEMMPDPVKCFCEKQAHLVELEEVGPVLVCHAWSNPQDRFMCGFHMHQDGWLQFRHELETGLPLSIDHSGLRSCRHFNFSFCTYFFVYNSFPKLLDNGPNCFCNKPTIEHFYKTPTGCFDMQLRCDKMYTNQKRCNFQVAARNIHHFLKSTCHPIATAERRRSKAHAHDLLLALLAKTDQQKSDWEEDKLDTCSSGDSSLTPKSQTPTTISPTLSHRFLLQNINCQNTSVLRKKSNATNSNQVTTPMTTPPPAETNEPLDLFELQQALPSPPLLATITDEQWASEKQQLKVEMDRLQQELEIQNRDTEYIGSMINQDKLQHEYNKYQNENDQYRQSINQCDHTRVTNQCKLTRLELQLAESKKREDEDNRERAMPKGEDFKCKLCFNRYIEYALIPCYHLAYCETCANRLKECAICRKPVTTMIKINMC